MNILAVYSDPLNLVLTEKKTPHTGRTAIFSIGVVCRASFKLSSFRSKTLLIELLITRTAYVKPLCEECACICIA